MVSLGQKPCPATSGRGFRFMTKIFSWEECKKLYSPEHVQFLTDTWNKQLSEEEFIAGMQKLREFSRAKRRKNKLYSPNKLKKQYRNLVEIFGFFVSPK